MGSVNKVILVGNLGRDAELRYTPGGAAVSKFSVATTEVWNDKAGQRQERTEWHTIDLWGKQAETLSEYLVKGKQVYVEGRLQTRTWDDDKGLRHWKTEIVANSVEMLSGRKKKDYAAESAAEALEAQAEAMGVTPEGESFADDDDESEEEAA